MTRLAASLLALALTGGSARAEPPGDPAGQPAPASPRPGGPPEARSPRRVGFGAELGGSPGVFGAKLGVGALGSEDDGLARRWMVWLEADGTDWFRPSHPADAGRVDQVLWLFPHLELSRQLVRPWALSGWLRAGPTLGRYTAGGGVARLWFPGLAVGAGLLLDPVRVGVTYYGQWKRTTVPVAGPSASPDVRMEPMVLVTAGMEFLAPFAR